MTLLLSLKQDLFNAEPNLEERECMLMYFVVRKFCYRSTPSSKNIKELFCLLFCTASTHGMTREHVLQMLKNSAGEDT